MKFKKYSNLFYPKLNYVANKKFTYDPYSKMVVSMPGGGNNFGEGGGCCGVGCCCCLCCCFTVK